MASVTHSIVRQDTEVLRRGLPRPEWKYPKTFHGSPLPPLPHGTSWKEYPIFQEGHPVYLGALRPSGPGPVRVHIPWDYDAEEWAKAPGRPYEVTYHDSRKGDDHWRNVEMAIRVSKSEAMNAADKNALLKFREGFKKVALLYHESYKAVLLGNLVSANLFSRTSKASLAPPTEYLSISGFEGC